MIWLPLLAQALAACLPVPAAAAVLDDRRIRYLFVGELSHGTNEIPAIFGDLVCAASIDRPVVVAIEQSSDDQPAIDAYLVSDGGATARAAFLTSPIWTNGFKDGRSSEAMFALIERLRLLRAAGRIAGVAAFALPAEPREGEDYNIVANRRMAEGLKRIAARYPNALVMVITGSVHASRSPMNFGNGPFAPAAALLPRAKTVSILADGMSGEAWACNAACEISPLVSDATGPRRLERRFRTLIPGEKLPGAFDGTVYVGMKFTASSPILPASAR